MPLLMAGQPEAADDLIAELAKLMAQDSKPQPVQPRQPAPQEPAAPAFSLRIPGEARPATPQPTQAKPESGEEPEPFRFDFDFTAPKPTVAAPSSAVPAPVAAATPKPEAVATAPSRPVPAPVAEPETEHDSIADLIAAELAVSAAPVAPQPVEAPPVPAAAPAVVREEVATAAPQASEPPATPRPAPARPSNLTAVNLGGNAPGHSSAQRPALRAVNLQPAAKPEADQFRVPPVFGVGGPSSAAPAATQTPAPVQPSFAPTPTAPAAPEQFSRPAPVVAEPAPIPVKPEPQPVVDEAPEVGLDPIDEIESLIGRAVRVELDAPEPRKPEPVVARPALSALAQPEPASVRPSRSNQSLSVDEAILAAAEATGAQVGWVDPAEVDEPAPRSRNRAERAPRRGISRAVAGPLVAVTLLLAAGFGLYWVLGLGRDSGPAPLLTADATPVKETPVVDPAADAPQQSVVFNEIDGVVPGAEEQLVSRDQADVNEVTQVAVPDVSDEGLANRKVRTVTVRPDGTIVSGDDSVAGNAILPVARPVVPEVPGAETASPELAAAAQQDTITAAAAPATATPETTTPAETAPATPAVTPVQPGTTVPVVDATGAAVPGKTAPVPMLRPAGLSQAQASTPVPAEPTSPVNAVVDTPLASLPPAPTATAATPAAAPEPVSQATEVAALPNDAPAYVQLASQRSEQEARQTANALITRYGPLFGGANMEVQRVDLGTRGIYYRVRVPANSLQEANSICTNVKAAGGDCFTQ